jgi:hypothetical protein
MAYLTCWDCKWFRRTRDMSGEWTFSCRKTSDKGIRYESRVTMGQKACPEFEQECLNLAIAVSP